VTSSDSFTEHVYELLAGLPVSADTAAGTLSRSSGAYAWWAFPTVLPDLPGLTNDHDRKLRLLYVGQASNLRGRILKTHLRRSGSSALRRTLAGLLMPVEGYRTMWKDGVVLIPDDELRLTAWMGRSLRLTWAEHPYPEDVERDLVTRFEPALNLHGVRDDDIHRTVVAAKERFESSARSPA
jgi:hypothetical protein